MGRKAGKHAKPKTAKGYHTTTGRRYGRRYAYVSFRPSFNDRGRDERQRDEDGERLELEHIQKKNSLRSSPSGQVSSHLLDEPLLENSGTAEPIYQNAPRQAIEANTSPLPVSCYGLQGKEITGNLMNPDKKSEHLAEYASGWCNDLNGQNGIGFISIDVYESDSSDGEEDDDQDTFPLGREASVVQGALDNVICELQKGVEYFTDFLSQTSILNDRISRECCEEAGPDSLMRNSSMDPGLAWGNNRPFRSSADDQAILGSNPNGANYEVINNTVNVEVGTCVAIANGLSVDDRNTDKDSSPELVVRCKSRKQNAADQMEGEKLLPSDEEESSWRRTEIAEVQQGSADCALRSTKEINSVTFFDSRQWEGHQKTPEGDLMKNAVFRSDSLSDEDEDSSECRGGEWPTALPSYLTAAEGHYSSSQESWEAVPTREESECEVQSSSSSGVEENMDFCFEEGEQAPLEEGEIPWLQHPEVLGSYVDEGNYPFDDFEFSGFLLDGGDNLEDDFSASEDLDMERRLSHEFEDNLELARSVSSEDPRFPSLSALEEVLQFLENALAELDALVFNVEQANPPASGETIDSLPQIIVTGEHEGEGHSCIICCSEYVKDEILIELPCHHLFHKTCVTRWLQQSGTCPICRHVLEPVVYEEFDEPFVLHSHNDS